MTGRRRADSSVSTTATASRSGSAREWFGIDLPDDPAGLLDRRCRLECDCTRTGTGSCRSGKRPRWRSPYGSSGGPRWCSLSPEWSSCSSGPRCRSACSWSTLSRIQFVGRRPLRCGLSATAQASLWPVQAEPVKFLCRPGHWRLGVAAVRGRRVRAVRRPVSSGSGPGLQRGVRTLCVLRWACRVQSGR
jgi:hypothetical protein